jgi:hypothetical protein
MGLRTGGFTIYNPSFTRYDLGLARKARLVCV